MFGIKIKILGRSSFKSTQSNFHLGKEKQKQLVIKLKSSVHACHFCKVCITWSHCYLINSIRQVSIVAPVYHLYRQTGEYTYLFVLVSLWAQLIWPMHSACRDPFPPRN